MFRSIELNGCTLVRYQDHVESKRHLLRRGDRPATDELKYVDITGRMRHQFSLAALLAVLFVAS